MSASSRLFLDKWLPQLAVSPALVVSLVLFYGLTIWVGAVSFTDSEGVVTWNWVGWEQYVRLFADGSWWRSLWNLAKYLPLVVGQGADQAAGLILPAVASRPRLRDRLEAMVRVDERRWDLRLKDGSLIQLPAIDEESALIQLDQLDQRQRILDMGFARIDLRDPEMVAVRPRDAVLPGQPAAGGA